MNQRQRERESVCVSMCVEVQVGVLQRMTYLQFAVSIMLLHTCSFNDLAVNFILDKIFTLIASTNSITRKTGYIATRSRDGIAHATVIYRLDRLLFSLRGALLATISSLQNIGKAPIFPVWKMYPNLDSRTCFDLQPDRESAPHSPVCKARYNVSFLLFRNDGIDSIEQ